jgi:predicted ATPase/DNA-binding winged helix-turn-helix (wHTH) protein
VAGADDIRTTPIASFGPFRLNSIERRLERNDEAVVIGSRSLDILIALVERAGEILSRRELMARVWPDVVVEEANLRVHITGLRRALGDGKDGARYVANVPGRGYCFVAPVQWRNAAPRALPAADVVDRKPGHGLPPRPMRMVGRAETVAGLSALLRLHRFVSVVGAGGMGKTTVAIAAAHALIDDFENAVIFVDLGALTDAALVPFSIASALDLQAPVQAQDPIAGILAFLGGRRILLLLDCCEHVIAAAAAAAERLFSEAPQVHLLVTSREALRVEGEHVYLVRPLETPPSGVELTAGQALASPAVQLFMERAVASGHSSALSDADANIVADMCRRLDGIALAIELAASRVGTYGIRGTADLLDSGLKLAWQGRRGTVPRHQTLQAMLDWSYHLLSERDRRVLYRLSVFVGTFALEGGQTVAAEAEMDSFEVANALANLVDKSLVSTSVGEALTFFRLLDTTRAYAAAKLASSGEEDQVVRKHASYYAGKLKAEAIDAAVFRGRNFSAYAPHVGNVRAAVAWSFSGRGDRAMAVQLAARSAPLFLGLGLLGECEQWCERALAAMDDERGSETELALREAQAVSSMYTRGGRDEVRAAIERGLELTDALGKWRHKLHLLGGLSIFLLRRGDHHGALEAAKRSLDAAQDIGNDHDIAKADWGLGCVWHVLGDQDKAQRHLELGFERAPVAAPVENDLFGDHRVRARSVLARSLWLRGFPDRAGRVMRQAIDEGERGGHPGALGLCLIWACSVSLWCGDLARAAEHIERLTAHARRYSLRPFEVAAIGLKAELEIARGAPGSGVELLRSVLAALQADRYLGLWTTFSRALAEGLARIGECNEAVATIDAALAWAEQTGSASDVPDLLCLKGQILLSSSNGGSTEPAEQVLLQSLTAAREQSALGWELRSAIALARLWAVQGRPDAARDVLLEVYERFTEGFATVDMRMAAQLLEQIERSAACD